MKLLALSLFCLSSVAAQQCTPSSGSGTAYVCALSQSLGSYSLGTIVQFFPDVNSTGGATTLSITGLGSKSVKLGDCSSNPTSTTFVASSAYTLSYNGTLLCLTGGGIPANAASVARRTCSIVVGADNGVGPLVNGDLGPQKQQCKVPYAATVVEIDVAADAGTPNVITAVRHCTVFTTGVCSTSTVTNLLSSALAAATGGFDACSNTGGTTGLDGDTTCSSTLQNTSVAAGDWLELVSGTAGGTAKRMSISIIFTVN